MFVVEMKRMSRPLLAVACLWLSAAAAHAELAPTDQLLPANTLVYVRIPDCVRFQEQFSQSSFGRMVNDPAMAEVRAEVMKKFEEASREAEKELGMPLSDLFALPTGEAAFAIVQPPGQKLGLVGFLDIGEHRDILDKLLSKAEAKLTEDGELTRSREEFEGTEVTVWTNENAGPRDPFNSVCYCIKETRAIVATGFPLMKEILARWGGGNNQSFAADPTYKYILQRCRPAEGAEPSLSWFLNPLGLFKAGMAAAGPEVGMQGAMVMGFLPVLGFDRLKGMGGTAEMGTGDLEAVSKSLIYVEQPVTGVLRAFVCPPAEQTPPNFIPATTANLNALHWDVPGAYEAIGQVYDFFTAPGTFGKMMDDAAGAPNGPGLHPKADFLDLLTGQIFMIQNFPKGENLEQQQIAMLFGVNNAARMQTVLAKLADMDGTSLAAREFRGTTIFEPENAPSGPFSPAWTVSQGYLIFSMNVELLESLLRGDADHPLAASAEFRRVVKEFPGPVSTFSIQHQDALIEAFYAGIKSGVMQGELEDFDPAILPDFDALRKYFGVVASYSVPDEHGVFMMSFGLKPE